MIGSSFRTQHTVFRSLELPAVKGWMKRFQPNSRARRLALLGAAVVAFLLAMVLTARVLLNQHAGGWGVGGGCCHAGAALARNWHARACMHASVRANVQGSVQRTCMQHAPSPGPVTTRMHACAAGTPGSAHACARVLAWATTHQLSSSPCPPRSPCNPPQGVCGRGGRHTAPPPFRPRDIHT